MCRDVLLKTPLLHSYAPDRALRPAGCLSLQPLNRPPLMQEHWKACLQTLQQMVPPKVFDTWTKPLYPVSWEDNMLTLYVPSRTFVEMMGKEMGKEIVAAIKTTFGNNVRINWSLDSGENTDSGKGTTGQPVVSAYSPQQSAMVAPLESYLRPEYSFQNFCEGKSNQVAYAIAKSIAENPIQTTFNPFFLFGASGVGKTHLVNAIGLALKEKQPSLRVLLVSAVVFRTQYTDSVLKNKLNDFLHFYQSIDVLIIDDFQEIQTQKTQQVFYHIFNHLHAINRKILITCDRAPSEFEGLEERILTRLKWGVTTEMERPDIALRRNILEAILRRQNITFPEDVVKYITENVPDSVRELQGTINSMIAFSLNDFCEMDIDLARRVVARVVNQVRKEMTIDMLLTAVCRYHKVKPAEVTGKSRKKNIVEARQLVIYLATKYTNASLSQIGREMGKRDHSTVAHSRAKLELRLSTDRTFRREIEEFEAGLKKQ